ncbi:OACYL [Cordylochernes scorpioides]|uniref:OACYL n=1 Tax=Cordylochernes scorpioides TaxID=51811 RepID=A0ABY6LC44_9ARAC|nr:OACYL [Cordylochernes scorpioides]
MCAEDPAQALKVLDNFFLEPLLQAPLSVDTFFLLSGMLLTYIFLKHSAKKPVNWIQFYVHRYLRLTPTYMLILAFWTTIFPHLLQSPLGLIRKDLSECTISWWWNLLYISNFRNSQCMGWSWYLANDMQFYIISPLFLIPLLKWPKIGLAILGALLLGSWVTIAIIADIFNIVPTLAGIGDITVFQIGALIDRIMKDEEISFKTKKRIVETLVFLVVTYEYENWTLRKEYRKRIVASEM